jgi:hypothetical protein
VKPTEDIRKRIKDAVAAKLGTQIEPALLDSIITRVVDTIERK